MQMPHLTCKLMWTVLAELILNTNFAFSVHSSGHLVDGSHISCICCSREHFFICQLQRTQVFFLNELFCFFFKRESGV